MASDTANQSGDPDTGNNLDGLFVVIAAFNEATVIGAVIRGLQAHVAPNRVIVVDDASTDHTSEAAWESGATVLRHPINRGQGAALATGIAAALRLGAKIIVTFDADGQHDPNDLPDMTEPIRTGEADIVLGTRFDPRKPSDVPAGRRALLKLGVWFTRIISQVRVTDMHNGFRAMSSEVAVKLRIRQDRMEHASEILDEIRRNHWRCVERPTRIRYTEYSMHKGQKNSEALRLAMRILFYKAGG